MSASSRLSRIAGLPLGCLALTLLMLVFSGAVAVAPAGAVTFASHADSATGSQPFAIAVGDFNGDGKLDLAAANYGADTVSILLGNGDGTFAAKTDYTTGVVPQSVAVGDFNGDGKLDLAVANGYADTVSILLGNGDGTFAAKTDYATGTLPQSVAVGDFNGDGKLDLVTANSSSSVNTVSILLGNGNGTFAAKTDYATGAVPLSVAVGDVNGDGKLDLAVANNNGTSVSILLGNGNGTFAAKTDYAAASWPQQVVVADFNLDGKQDLGVVASPASTVCIYLGDGSGTFAAKVDYATGSQPGSVAVGDVNGDGRPDLTTANWNANTVSVLLGNGNGSFAAKTDFATGAGPVSVAVGDFNADGKLDVATANISANMVSVLLNTGSPPAGSVSLDGGATWSNSRSVTIDSAVTGATQMRFRDQGGAWSAWETYAATKSWTVPDGDGSKTVQAQYCNADATLTCSDSIGLDTTPPDITVPVWESDMTLEAASPAGNVVNFHVTITDAVDPAPALTITPASGSIFPLGATTVTLTGTDAAGNTATKTLKVTIKDTGAPHLTPTDNITAEATGPGGAVVDFTATATDTGDAHPAVTSVPASGSVFHLGTTLVTVTATDASGNIATGTFSVWVRDTTWPTLAKPDDITAEATGPGGAHVSWADIVATDAVDGNITAVCTPASGSLFALGETTVNVVALDAHGNSSATTFKVTVEAPPSLIHVPDDYATIQAAVAAASPGDTVAVAAGTYYEHVTIDKPLTLTGAGAGATVVDGSGIGPVLTVSGAGVTVRELTVTHGGSGPHPAGSGIRVAGASGATFDGVESSFNEAGYFVLSSSGTTVRNGTMHDNNAFAFDNGDTGSPDTLIVDCDVYDNLGTQGGGALNAYAGSSGFTVRRTHVHDNVNAGVQIGWSSAWLVEDSTLERNAHGVSLDTASSGTCRRCAITDNTGNGVSLGGWGPSGNLFAANHILRNAQDGCRLSGPNANGNVFRENTIGANAVGVAITHNTSGDNTGNRFYRNDFASNTLQALDESVGGNLWDNGLPDGGNWWSDWTAPDADHDGFVDAAYVFATGQDNHPFAERLPALTVPDDYATIQAAVAAASPGDTVAVADGTYHEHLNIAKPLTLTGAGAGATVIDGSGSGPVLTVSGAGVTVRQLTVTNGGSSTHPASNGIRVVNASDATFDGVECSFNEAAYMVVSSSGTTVRNGSMHDNHAFAFDNGDTYSADTLIVDCDVYDNLGTQGGGAINAYAGSTGFTVRRTHVHDNVNAGVQIGWSSGWLVEDSTLARNAHGLILDTASSGTCRRCELSDNTGYGVSLGGWGPYGNLFVANHILRNAQGCRLSGPSANGNVFRENTIGANAVGVAITLNTSGDNTGNRFYRNNFASNTLQALDESVNGNFWDNGLPDGGNWWSDWTAPDADHDGFVDAPYVFATGQDDHPFVDRLPAIRVPDDYATIQAAVAAASSGDTVAVAAGTYYEHVTIDKPLTLTGAGAGATVVDGSGIGPVLTVSGAGVTVRELTVTHGGSGPHPAGSGVRVAGASGATFDGVESSFNEAGYFVLSSSGTTVRNGSMHDNNAYAFDNGDTGSPDTLIVDCEVYNNLGAQGGGALNAYAGSSGFTVRRTHVHDNAQTGVQIGWSSAWLVEDCTLERNAHGVSLDTASSGICRRCAISDNSGNGVSLGGWGPSGNLFAANHILRNAQGIRLSGPNANGNVFRENTIGANAVGVAITHNTSGDNTGNRFYRNNFASNTLQALDESVGGNLWDNGLPDGGNWWSDWTAPDADHDGFVDAPYVFTGGQDNHPFAAEVVPRAFEVHRTVESTGTYASVYFKGWTIGATLAVTIDDPATPQSPDYERSVVAPVPEEGNDGFGIGVDDYEVKPGDVVTVTDGSIAKSHTVTAIAVTEIDTAADVVRGTAVPRTDLTVYASDENGYANRWTTAAGDGTWAVDFSTSNDPELGVLDIVPGTTGSAEQFDADGDSTVYDLEAPRGPFFSVSPLEPAEHAWGEGWRPNSEVAIEIDDRDTAGPVDFATTAGTDGFGRFELYGMPFDIEAGHVVTVSQGATVKTHVVIDLTVTLMDPVVDTVSGIGKPNTETVVNVWGDPLEQGSQRIVTSNGAGVWTADFSVPGADGSPAFDIHPDMMTYTYQADEDGDQTQIDYRLFSISATVPDGSQSWPSGSSPDLGWTVSPAVDVGQFGVWLIDQATGSWYSAGYFAAEAGKTSYTPSFSTLGIPTGTYKAVVYYREDPGVWTWSANATSPGTAEITPAAFSISATVPDGSQSWPSGSSPDLGWTVSPAVDVGQFGVWLIDQATGSWYSAGYFAAEAGKTSYTPSFSTLGIPTGTYKAVVYYREDPGVWTWSANATSPGTAEITPAAFSISATVPDGSQSWPSGSSPDLGWTVSPAVDVGQFGVWLIDQATGSWYSAGYFAAEAGKTSYTPSFSTLGIPTGTYKAVVYYREDPGVWTWSANATSPGTAEITPAAFSISATVPDGSQSWPSGSSPDLGWTVSPAVDVGQFGVWLIDQATGSWYSAGYFAAEAGKTSYTPSFSTLGIPTGTYKAVVYYREDPGVWTWSANATSPGTAEITP